MPTTPQLILLCFSIALLAAGGWVSLMRLWKDREGLRVAAKGCMYTGLTAALAVILWNSLSWRQCPLNNNFSSLVLLGLLLGLFVMYMQRVHPIAGLDWFIMPVVVLLLAVAAASGRVDYHQYHPLVSDTWLWVHRLVTFGGAIAFAFAAAGGAMYLIASRRLRQKRPLPAFGSLERLEHLLMHSVSLGFALLTLGLVTGFFRLIERAERPPLAKLVLGCLAWLIYAIVLHAPLTPRLRGRRAAILSICGFILLIGTLIVVQLMPGGTR